MKYNNNLDNIKTGKGKIILRKKKGLPIGSPFL
jgi:hypothetical protein